jgi:hypothetical protein
MVAALPALRAFTVREPDGTLLEVATVSQILWPRP